MGEKIVLIAPAIRRYDWGTQDVIAGLLGAAGPEKIAEAWFGAHPLAPAHVEGCETPLDAWLGSEQLPYLLKLLSASRPLSIQVHPNIEQARAGFAREEALGVPRAARNRSYRDESDKPELMLALTPFEALVGLRPLPEVVALLAGLGELRALAPQPEAEPAAVRAWLGRWLSAREEQRRTILAAVADALDALPVPEANRDLFRELRLTAHDADPGLLFVLLMRRLVLQPGEAIYLPAGCVHAYVRGTGIEVMASSDNVVRAGLTSKHIDTAEFLRIADLKSPVPAILSGRSTVDGRERLYDTPARAFELSVLTLTSGQRIARRASSRETLLNIGEGTIIGRGDGGEVRLGRGQACVVPAGVELRLTAERDATCVRVTVPPSHGSSRSISAGQVDQPGSLDGAAA